MLIVFQLHDGKILDSGVPYSCGGRIVLGLFCAVARRAIISYARSVHRRESTSRNLMPLVSQPLEIIQLTSEFDPHFPFGDAMLSLVEYDNEVWTAAERDALLQYVVYDEAVGRARVRGGNMYLQEKGQANMLNLKTLLSWLTVNERRQREEHPVRPQQQQPRKGKGEQEQRSEKREKREKRKR